MFVGAVVVTLVDCEGERRGMVRRLKSGINWEFCDQDIEGPVASEYRVLVGAGWRRARWRSEQLEGGFGWNQNSDRMRQGGELCPSMLEANPP